MHEYGFLLLPPPNLVYSEINTHQLRYSLGPSEPHLRPFVAGQEAIIVGEVLDAATLVMYGGDSRERRNEKQLGEHCVVRWILRTP